MAASLALGAEGVLLGTRFLATEESPLHANFKQAIVDSDGHDTMLTEIPDIATGTVWPGAMARARRNKFVERWAGREWALRQNQEEVFAGLRRARESGDADEGALLIGQDAKDTQKLLEVTGPDNMLITGRLLSAMSPRFMWRPTS